MNDSKPFGPRGDGASGTLRARLVRRALLFPSPLPTPLGRGRMVRSLWTLLATGFAKPVWANHAPGGRCSFSPGERVRVRGNDGLTATERRISKGVLSK
jgi:hypothetical protein